MTRFFCFPFTSLYFILSAAREKLPQRRREIDEKKEEIHDPPRHPGGCMRATRPSLDLDRSLGNEEELGLLVALA